MLNPGAKFLLIFSVILSLCKAIPLVRKDIQNGTCAMIGVAIALPALQFGGRAVNARSIRAAAGVAALTSVLDGIATWLAHGSFEDHANTVQAASTTVTVLAVVIGAGLQVAPNTAVM